MEHATTDGKMFEGQMTSKDFAWTIVLYGVVLTSNNMCVLIN